MPATARISIAHHADAIAFRNTRASRGLLRSPGRSQDARSLHPIQNAAHFSAELGQLLLRYQT